MSALANFRFITAAFKPHFFGFFQGHGYLTEEQTHALETLVGVPGQSLISEYEHAFANTACGGGHAVSFASGRMAFHEALCAQGIGPGDEVLLTGFTCSVMANAVWRTGATARYADINPDTLGTCADDVARKITSKTKALVVQHTFGIPCDIDLLANLARERGIFLIEDCALSVGSKLDGRLVGTWGDAAVFSTDRSKPINTLTGGVLCTRDSALYEKVKARRDAAPDLSPEHQWRLWKRIMLERKWFAPKRYGRGRFIAKLSGLCRKVSERVFGRAELTFLENDFKPRLKSGYPYPARFPAFLAQLGLLELARWNSTVAWRKELLLRFLECARKENVNLPSAYHDARREIIPLRVAYTHPDAPRITNRMRESVDLDWIWFREPVSFATGGPAAFGYQPGECPASERVGSQIINWPCDIPPADADALLSAFRKAHSLL